MSEPFREEAAELLRYVEKPGCTEDLRLKLTQAFLERAYCRGKYDQADQFEKATRPAMGSA